MTSRPNENLLPRDGEALYFAQAFSSDESKRMLEAISSSIRWRQEPIKIFGKSMMQPRLTCWVGDEGASYRYSGITLNPEAWTPELKLIKGRIEDLTRAKFNGALLNFYRDGQDSMGWHRDNEAELGTNPVIASVSFGATRVFKMRHYFDKTLKVDIPLENGSLLLMSGPTQHYWEHAIPKTTRPIAPRMNLTFRLVDPSFKRKS